MNEKSTLFSTEEMLQGLTEFDPIAFKYYYGKSQEEIKREINKDNDEGKRYKSIVEYEKSHQFSCLTKRNYAGDYENLNLVYGERDNTLRNINLMELVLNKWISQYINIDGMERLFSETYIEFEWEMHLSADYKKHNMKFYRDHFFHQVKDTYMMYKLLKDHGFYERVREILLNGSESKVSRFVSRSLVQQKYYESDKIRKLRSLSSDGDDEFYIRNLIYMATLMAGLFHDIGYPEAFYMTTSRHIRDYIASIHELNADGSGINRIYSLLQNSLLFRVESFENIEERLTSTNAEHGTLSAIIFLIHFYENGAIYMLSPYKKAAVELAALAIYNHTNKYGIQGEKEYSMYRPCFALNPISWLLRICDDLQEWERIYFVISDKSNIVICNNCKTPIIGFREDGKRGRISRYRCNCQFLQENKDDGSKDTADVDKQIQAFDGVSKFSYRRIYNVSVCDKVEVKTVRNTDKKLLCRLHYDPYKLLHVTYLNATYAKYRISELNQLKKLLECQKGIPQIYLDYFVTSNPVHIKVKLLEEYLEYQYKYIILVEKERYRWRKGYIENMVGAGEPPLKSTVKEFDAWRDERVEKITQSILPLKEVFLQSITILPLKEEFLRSIKTLNLEEEVVERITTMVNNSYSEKFQDKMKKYMKIALDFYAKLLLYQWVNEYLNNFRIQSYKHNHQVEYHKCNYILLQSEWNFAQEYFRTPELRCMVEDCFLQFTRMYLDITECDFFPENYYEQYKNGEREKIFQVCFDDENGNEFKDDIAKEKRYVHESQDYYYKALLRYTDAELYQPIAMKREEGDMEVDVVEEKRIDAYTDLYLFYLMNREIKDN